MEKISVRLLVLAAAMIAPNLVRSDDKLAKVKHVDQISAEKLLATTRAEQYCVYSIADKEKIS